MKLFCKRIAALLVVALMLCSIIPTIVFAQSQPKNICLNGHNYGRRINSVAHRGYSKSAPENTLPAYRMAKEKGFFYVECDVIYTKDNVPVLIHLADIKHTSNGSGQVSQLTYEQLLNYDFGSWKGAEFAGTKIPTFEEFVALCAQINLHPYIELKESGKFNQEKIQQLVDILEKYDMLRQCTWITFIHDYLFYVRNCDPYARMGLLWPNDVNNSVVEKAKSIRTNYNQVFLNVNYDNLSANGINLASANNLPVEVYTINTEADILSMPEYISGVTSDWIVAQSVIGQSNCVITPPTCTEPGYSTYTCIDCGESYVGDYVDALGHEYAGGDKCLRCEYENEKYTYFVYDTALGGNDNNNGLTPYTPVATLDKAVKLAQSSGAGKGDTITINLKGNVAWGGNINNNGISTNWEVLTPHDFKLVVTASDSTAILGDGNKNIIFGGDIQFDNVKINAGSNWKSLCFEGHNAVFNNTAFVNDYFDLILGTRAQHIVNEPTEVLFNSFRPKIFVGNSYHTITFNKKFTLNLAGNPTVSTGDVILIMGPGDDGKTIYNEGANIITNIPNTLKFQNANKVEVGENGFFNIINNNADKTIDSASIGLTNLVLSKTWVLNLSVANIVKPTDEAGVFTVPTGYVATAVSSIGDSFKSAAGKLILSAGQYSVTASVCNEHIYDDSKDNDCNLCLTVREDDDPVCEHNFNWVVDKAANCGYDGVRHKECSLCHSKTNQNSVILATGKHTYDNSCDTKCNVCYKSRTVKHNLKWVVDKAANCGYDGVRHKECSLCHIKINQGSIIPATGKHNYSNKADVYCNVCNKKRNVSGVHFIKENGKWLCYINGERFTKTAVVKSSGKYFYVKNGERKSTTGIVKHNGKWFYIKNGEWSSTTKGIIKYKNKNFFICKGKWNSAVTTLYKKDGKYLAIKGGKWYKGKAIINYSGKRFYVNKGYAQLSFTGKVVINSKTVKIKNGKLV